MTIERCASASSVRRLLEEHAPDDGEVMVNRVGNLNVYTKDGDWLGIISLKSIRFIVEGDPLPEAEWEEM